MLPWKPITLKFSLNKTESASLSSHVVFKTVLTLLFFSPQPKMEGGTQATNVFRTAKNQHSSSGSAFSTTNHPRICHQPWKLDAKQLRNIWCIPEAQLMSSVIFQSDIITKHYLTLKGLPIPSFTRSRKASSLSELSWYFPCIEKVASMNN